MWKVVGIIHGKIETSIINGRTWERCVELIGNPPLSSLGSALGAPLLFLSFTD